MVSAVSLLLLRVGVLMAVLALTSSASLIAFAGEKAPDLRLTGLSGQEIRASRWRGKTLVVNFWATWCKPCLHEMPELVRFYEANREKNVIVLGVAMDKHIDRVRSFVEKLKVTYPVLIGDIATARSWRVRGLPMTFIVSPGGNIERVIRGGLTQANLESALTQFVEKTP